MKDSISASLTYVGENGILKKQDYGKRTEF